MRAVTGAQYMFGGREACYFCVCGLSSSAAVDDVEGSRTPEGEICLAFPLLESNSWHVIIHD